MSRKKNLTEQNSTKVNPEQFEMLLSMLDSVYHEIKELSKKKQDGALNEIKVKMINRILSKVKNILKDDPSAEYLDLLDDVTLPTNSDVVIIISQFKVAMEQYRYKYF